VRLDLGIDWGPQTIDAGIADARNIIELAVAEYGPIQETFLLISGGNDSMVLYDVCREWADEIVHINTGIGIPQTNQFVRDVVGPDLIEMHPPVPYETLILDPKLFGGFPGPAAHHFIYARLKERCIRKLIADRRTKRGQRFMLLTGIRNDESKRRMGYANAVDRMGGQVWVNPLIRWSNDLMREYRETKNLPVNEVTKHLHMSGECLCGAFARPGELEEIRFFYPEVAERIEGLEAKCREAGLRSCKWGAEPPKAGSRAAGPMCQSCTLWDDPDEVAA
jgi:3'-phosphoadenosine 5'-phosphosulfate sulfotransferase (PAPS reductase)/FAD synthetase